MSRGLGPVQLRVLSVLLACEGWAVETSGLKSLVGGDRSNLRCAMKGLLRRGMIREWSEEGLRYYELSLLGWIRAVPLDLDDPAQISAEEALCCRLSR